MDENSKKEEFSYGYIHTLASACGYITKRATRPEDNRGIDLEIKDIHEDGEMSIVLVQTKCTTPKYFLEEGDCFKYDLKVENYKQLIQKTLDLKILILIIVPENEEWINICKTAQKTTLKKCGYWISLTDHKQTDNLKTVRIKVPKKNLLTAESLTEIMEESLEKRRNLFNV